MNNLSEIKKDLKQDFLRIPHPLDSITNSETDVQGAPKKMSYSEF